MRIRTKRKLKKAAPKLLAPLFVLILFLVMPVFSGDPGKEALSIESSVKETAFPNEAAFLNEEAAFLIEEEKARLIASEVEKRKVPDAAQPEENGKPDPEESEQPKDEAELMVEEYRFVRLGGYETPASVEGMIRLGLNIVSRSCGYSLSDRTGLNGSFDCSGLLAVLLRDGLGEQQIGWDNGEPWDTAYWRYFASLLPLGSKIHIGNATYQVTMKESYDFEKAWQVPGAIVIQYPPDNGASSMGHASVALGAIPYTTVADVLSFLGNTYGVDLSGTAGGPNGIPMVYDPYGPGSGHITWRINANGVAKAVCVDNNYMSNPEWTERIAIVLAPVNE